MILTIDTTGKRFTVTKAPEPKTMNNGEHRADKATGLPLWSTQLVVVDNDGGDIISVTTAGEKPPPIELDDPVTVHGLVAIPWDAGNRHGIAFRAIAIQLEADVDDD